MIDSPSPPSNVTISPSILLRPDANLSFPGIYHGRGQSAVETACVGPCTFMKFELAQIENKERAQEPHIKESRNQGTGVQRLD